MCATPLAQWWESLLYAEGPNQRHKTAAPENSFPWPLAKKKKEKKAKLASSYTHRYWE